MEKGREKGKKKRGIVGIEAAIVLIAFVIVAAALAFVALNMGLFTTQKSKEVIGKGLGEASTALEVDGSALGISNSTHIVEVSVPIKTSAGVSAVDLSPSRTSIGVIVGGTSFENIYNNILYYNGTDQYLYYANGTKFSASALSDLSTNTIANAIWSTAPSSPQAYVVILKNVNYDSVLEFSEKAIVLINLGTANALPPYGKLSVEIRPPEGAPLTLERTMPPNLPTGAVSLG
ncbi:MAG: archaellin/type IV pilin N-terminal domain-containing protein [Desulfurococcales archaeon]|jgi:flagellin FlaB|uniref:Flagellin n=1 Tax=Fervidicoccus fontis TaxID=683846 RepID=A0A7J3SK81_9CREN